MLPDWVFSSSPEADKPVELHDSKEIASKKYQENAKYSRGLNHFCAFTFTLAVSDQIEVIIIVSMFQLSPW